MVSEPQAHSKSRLATYERYGEMVKKELQEVKGKNYFLVKDVSTPGTIKCLIHISERTRNQYLSDICAELQARGILARHGRTFYFIGKKRVKKEK